MTITFGSTSNQVKDATADELLDAILTPDGCGSKLKTYIICELLKRVSMYQEEEILEALDGRMAKYK